jgi:predicted acyltransferase
MQKEKSGQWPLARTMNADKSALVEAFNVIVSGLKVKRYITIDAFRGFAVLLMVFVSTFYLFTYNIPFPLLHNQGDVFLFFDLVAPIFQFVLGMALFLFVARMRARKVDKKYIESHLLQRYILLIALGFVLDSITYLSFQSWGILETLGLGGILTFLLSDRTDKGKMIISASILSAYSLLYYNPVFYSLISMPHGGPVGAISYAILSVLGYMVAERLYHRRSDRAFSTSMMKYALALIVVGLLLSMYIPLNKERASPSFVLFSGGIILIFYLTFFAIYKATGYTFDILRAFGKVALTMWVVMYIFSWIFLFLLQIQQFLDFIPGLLASIAVTVLMYFVALILKRFDVKLGF